jgi:hypothetical protein
MAEKRMFTQKIIDSDAFLEMPTSAQALYFHLNMRADDDGFVNNPKKITRYVGAADDDLKLLLVKRFIIGFDSGVIVIKHWRMHNTLKNDRYKPTDYQEEFAMLRLKENKAYTDKPAEIPDGTKVEPEWNQSGTEPEPQNRIDKNRIDKIREDNNARARLKDREDEKDDGFQAFWSAYPKKNGGDIREAFMEYDHATETMGIPKETLIKAAKELAEVTTAEEVRFLPNAAKWLRNRGWEQKAAPAPAKQKSYTTAAEAKRRTTIDVDKLKMLEDMMN